MAANNRLIVEEVDSFRDGHIQHIGDALAFELNFQCVSVVPRAFAHFARNIDIGQEVHFNFDGAIA